MYKLGFEEAEKSEIKLPTFTEAWRKQESQKNIYFCFINYTKAFDCMNRNKLWKILIEMGVQIILPVPWETCMQVKKQQLEPCMDQLTGSGLRKEQD